MLENVDASNLGDGRAPVGVSQYIKREVCAPVARAEDGDLLFLGGHGG